MVGKIVGKVVARAGFEGLKKAGEQIGYSAVGAAVALAAITGVAMLMPKAAAENPRSKPKSKKRKQPKAQPKQ